jgi:hypothetical protein
MCRIAVSMTVAPGSAATVRFSPVCAMKVMLTMSY